MTPEQHQAETARAAVIRSQTMGRIYDNTQGAIADIHRRVVSEPWYGRDVFDSTWQQQMGYDSGQAPAPAPSVARDDHALNSFYGNEHGTDAGKGLGRGQEP